MLNSSRGRIQPPNLDDRTWQDLVDEAKALIPKYAPQWTDTSASDLGVTLIELFAWLVEGLIYRLNRVPDKNYIAFLNLLNIQRTPAVPAHIFLTFTAQPAHSPAATPVIVPAKTQAKTQSSETETPVIFETDEDLSVLPTNLKTILQVGGGSSSNPNSPNTYVDITSALTTAFVGGYQITLPGAPAVVTGQPAQQAQPVLLFFGFDQQTNQEIDLRVILSSPIPPVDTSITPPIASNVLLQWSYSQGNSDPVSGANDPSTWPPLLANQTPGVTDNTNSLQHDGTVSIFPPTSWSAQAPNTWKTLSPPTNTDPLKVPLFWIKLSITNNIPPPTAPTPPIDISFGFNALLFNTVSAHNALTIPVPEPLGTSDGSTFQVFSLQHAPLFKQPNTDRPYQHLDIQVDGTSWTQIDDFPLGAGNYYQLDPIAGEIRFGNFSTSMGQPDQPGGHGSIPPQNSQITATTYRYVAGGLSGNVGVGKVNQLVNVVPNILGVTNQGASFDAADEEPIEDTLRRAPLVLKSRDRAVTASDYEFLALEASNEVAIVRCLPPRLFGSTNTPPGLPTPTNDPLDPWEFANISRAPGNVNVIIVPRQGQYIARPRPGKDLLQEVQTYLDQRRDLTALLHVSGPFYLPIAVTATVVVWDRAIKQGLVDSPQTVADEITRKIQQYLHPVYGGLDGQGWQVGQSVFIADLFKAIMPDDRIAFISSIKLAADTPDYGPNIPKIRPNQPPSDVWVSLADYELVCCGQINIPPPQRV